MLKFCDILKVCAKSLKVCAILKVCAKSLKVCAVSLKVCAILKVCAKSLTQSLCHVTQSLCYVTERLCLPQSLCHPQSLCQVTQSLCHVTLGLCHAQSLCHPQGLCHITQSRCHVTHSKFVPLAQCLCHLVCATHANLQQPHSSCRIHNHTSNGITPAHPLPDTHTEGVWDKIHIAAFAACLSFNCSPTYTTRNTTYHRCIRLHCPPLVHLRCCLLRTYCISPLPPPLPLLRLQPRFR